MTNKIPVNIVVAQAAPHNKDYIMSFWYDWFCRETSLINKGESLLKKLKAVVNANRKASNIGGRFDEHTSYVWFKNNCPMRGSLYDDFRICNIASGDVIFTITPRSGHTGEAEVWGKPNGFAEPIVQGTWKDVLNYFKA